MNKTKEILEKQLDLLLERSKFCDDKSLAPITEQMIGVARMMKYYDLKPIQQVETSGNEISSNGNSGNENSGYRNSGNRNSGNWNSGNWNSGNWNSGNRNSGNWNSGNWNSGNRNSGDWNSGNENSGDWNSGNRNSGNRNSGDWNSGNRNSGNWNSGSWNSGDFNTGFFNTQTPKISLFNKPTDLSMEEVQKIKGIQILYGNYKNNIWIDADKMTEQEQQEHPEYKITRGYLKTIPYKEAYALMWAKLTKEEKQEVMAIPNFNAEIFKEITGIEVDK